LEIADTACDGVEAVEKACSTRPDVILMDINMPRLDGLGATERIMGRAPVPIVVMSATLQADTHEATFQALEAGALAFVPKPRSMSSQDFGPLCNHLTRTLCDLATIPVALRRREAATEETPLPAAQLAYREVVALGLSTGGPPVLRDLLAAMGEGSGLPLLVAQHLSPGFENSLATWLQPDRGPRVTIAEDGITPTPGVCYLAPGGMDMTVGLDGRLQLRLSSSGLSETPSIHALFSSVRRVYGMRVIAALMTGRGRDGVDALLELKNAGALTIVQQRDGCPVYDLPAAAFQLGAARASLTPIALGRTLANCR
jgi:two-component system chemotaxis response regulator CheB